ncbi:TPA: radical SAM protein [Bacillus cereus]
MKNKKSRYVINTFSDDEKSNIFFNLKNGVGIKVDKNISKNFKSLSENPTMNRLFSKYDFYSSEGEVEKVWDDYKNSFQDKFFHLIILPHENCNFRCVYCYERFENNKMELDIEKGIMNFVETKLKENNFSHLVVSWFGGEPLLAVDVIERLSEKFITLCNELDVTYFSHITTNGYNLTPKNFEILTKSKVSSYQITIDGVKETHDKQRKLIGGQSTYDRIIDNLILMSKTNVNFEVHLRMNVGMSNIKYVDDFIDNMKLLFGNDPRYSLYFYNIKKWGGDNDSNLDICPDNLALTLAEKTINREMRSIPIKTMLQRNNSCYASSPNSFVLGVDGTVYKCTIALYEDYNKVGYINKDGEMILDDEKLKLWVSRGIEDSGCKSCFFAPSCHGDSCPLVRIQTSKRPCPQPKKDIKDVIRVMDKQGHTFIEIKQNKKVKA